MVSAATPGTLADKQESAPSPRHPSGNVHLLVLTHGMWGNPSHLAELYRIICETKQQASLDSTSDARLEVLLAESNRDEGTYDGIDWGGERVTQEIFDLKTKLETNGETITKFSITGYSLGGLVARYVIGILYQRSFFSCVMPVNFNTFATPHVGLPGYDTLFNKLSRTLGPKLLGRTGTQFYAVDKWGPRDRPLLAVMSDPDQVFYKALCLFPRVTIYANAVNDLTVPYVTAAIEAHDPFLDHHDSGLEVEFLPDYKPVIASVAWPDHPPPKPPVAARERVVKFLTNKNPGPPFLQFGFPGNFIMWALLPLLTPLLFGIAYTRLSLSAGRSAGRIKLLEADETFSQRLVHAVADLERNLEEAIVDMTDMPSDDALRAREMDPGSKPTSGTATPALAEVPATTVATASPGPSGHTLQLGSRPQSNPRTGKSAPILSPLQLKIIEQLNAIPQLQKQLVYLHPYRNTHATIVSRDVKNFEFHKAGWGGIRHWADHFQL